MKIITKKIRTVVMTNILVLGLGACASTPEPWTQANDSPWSSKHEAGENSVPADKIVSNIAPNDPVLLANPEPVVMERPEAVPAQVSELIPAPAPEAVKKPAPEEKVVQEEMTPEQKILALPTTDYAVQVYASKTPAGMEKFKLDKALTDLMTVRTDRKGNVVYVLLDIHPDLASANQAAGYLEKRIGTKPWVRSVAGVQKIVVAK